METLLSPELREVLYLAVTFALGWVAKQLRGTRSQTVQAVQALHGPVAEALKHVQTAQPNESVTLLERKLDEWTTRCDERLRTLETRPASAVTADLVERVNNLEAEVAGFNRKLTAQDRDFSTQLNSWNTRLNRALKEVGRQPVQELPDSFEEYLGSAEGSAQVYTEEPIPVIPQRQLPRSGSKVRRG